MDITKIFFKAVDVLFYLRQNFKFYKGIEIKKNLKYDDCPVCKLNLHYKKNRNIKNKLPVMVHIHGGGFNGGSKDCRFAISNFWASEGFFVVNANYGLSPKYKYDDLNRHLALIMKWIIEYKDKYNLDLNNVSVTGDSAGGYATIAIGVLYSNEKYRKTFGAFDFSKDIKIANLFPVCGLYNLKKVFTSYFPFHLPKYLATSMTGIKMDKNLNQLKFYEFEENFNLLNFINRKFPTTYIACSKHDFFCRNQANELADVLFKNNISYKKFTAYNLLDNHIFHEMRWHSNSAKQYRTEMRDYVSKFVVK